MNFKKLYIVGSLFFLLNPISIKSEEFIGKAYATIPENTKLAVLKQPGKKPFQIIAKINGGDELEIIGKYGLHWLKVRFEDKEGYVLRRFVEASIEHDFLTIYAFNVGQGESYLIHCPNGKNILFDAGSSYKQQDDSLRDFYITHLDHHSRNIHYAFISHPDIEHYSLLPFLSDAYNFQNLFFVGSEYDYSSTFWEWFQSHNIYRLKTENDEILKSIDCGSADVKFLSAGLQQEWGQQRIDTMAVVMSVSYGKFSALFTSDSTLFTEQHILATGKLSEHDVITIGRHGSTDNSNSADWLEAINPKIAIMSSSASNKYWFPKEELITDLENVLPVSEYQVGYQVSVKDEKSGGYRWTMESSNKGLLQTHTVGNIKLRAFANENIFVETEHFGLLRFVGDEESAN